MGVTALNGIVQLLGGPGERHFIETLRAQLDGSAKDPNPEQLTE